MSSPADRRAFPRVSVSRAPWLTASTLYSPRPVDLLDISNGGALIESDKRLKPGERESFVLCGLGEVKVAAKVLRVQVIQLQPKVAYRSAIQFIRPISINTLGANPEQLPSMAQPGSDHHDVCFPRVSSPHVEDVKVLDRMHEYIERELRRLPRVKQIRICDQISDVPDHQSMYFVIPAGQPRLLQVSFAADFVPTAAEFQALKSLTTRLAAGLPPAADQHPTLTGLLTP